jgi:hypothetical protein
MPATLVTGLFTTPQPQLLEQKITVNGNFSMNGPVKQLYSLSLMSMVHFFIHYTTIDIFCLYPYIAEYGNELLKRLYSLSKDCQAHGPVSVQMESTLTPFTDRSFILISISILQLHLYPRTPQACVSEHAQKIHKVYGVVESLIRVVGVAASASSILIN